MAVTAPQLNENALRRNKKAAVLDKSGAAFSYSQLQGIVLHFTKFILLCT